jgi:hypothetical protein
MENSNDTVKENTTCETDISGTDPYEAKIRPPREYWVEDKWGNQGCIHFDGIYYWLTMIDTKSGRIWPAKMSQKEFDDRNKNLQSRIDARNTKVR